MLASNILDLRSGSDIYTIKELLYISSSGFSVSYNNNTGQISVSGGSYSFKYETHHSTDPANYIGIQKTITCEIVPAVYFLNNAELESQS